MPRNSRLLIPKSTARIARSKFERIWIAPLLFLLASTLDQTPAKGSTYVFTSMVPMGFYVTGPGNYPAINNLGQVVSNGYDDNSHMQIGFSDGFTTVGLLNPTASNSIDSDMWINDSGQVLTLGPSGLILTSRSSVSAVANTTGYTPEPESYSDANLVNSPIAWVGYKSSLRALFLTSGSATQTLSTGEDLFNPFINTSGVVCYTMQTGSQTAIYTTNGTTTQIVATASSNDISVIGLGMDARSDVLWDEHFTNGNSDLWLTSPGGNRTLIADTTGAYANFSDAYSGSASLSPAGNIAFVATLKNGKVGIFTGTDPVADKVIEQGDSLFGGTVGSVVSFGSDAINDNGSLAFVANANNHDYVVRADVPEPAGIGITLAGGALLVLRRQRGRGASN